MSNEKTKTRTFKFAEEWANELRGKTLAEVESIEGFEVYFPVVKQSDLSTIIDVVDPYDPHSWDEGQWISAKLNAVVQVVGLREEVAHDLNFHELSSHDLVCEEGRVIGIEPL